MTTEKWTQPDSTTQDATTYKNALESAALILHALAGQFNVRASDTPGLSVVIEAGVIFAGGANLIEKAQQSISGITAPATNPRKDLIEMDPLTGTAYRIAGVEAASPALPAVTEGRVPLAYYQIAVGATTITNSMIIPVRFNPWLAAARTDVTTPGTAQASKALVVDANKNMSGLGPRLAIGGTSRAWGSPYNTTLDVGDGVSLAENSNGDFTLTANAYYDGANWRYITNGYAAIISARKSAGNIAMFTAPTGIANGIVTLSERMIIANDGTTKINGNTVWHAGNLAAGTRGCLATKNAYQSIPNITNTAITFETEAYDTDSIHSVGSPTRMTVPNGVSMVRLSGSVSFAANSGGDVRYFFMHKNGALMPGGGRMLMPNVGPNANTIASMVSAIVEVIPGDYFELLIYHNSGGAWNVDYGSQSTWFSMEIIK